MKEPTQDYDLKKWRVLLLRHPWVEKLLPCSRRPLEESIAERPVLLSNSTHTLSWSSSDVVVEQHSVDELFKDMRQLRSGAVTISHVLACVWCAIRLSPTDLHISDVINVSKHPFDMTATSNITEGSLLSKLVALKSPRQTQKQPASFEVIQRFFFEAVVALDISHPNILPVLGIYTSPTGEIFLVSELMEHGSLLEYTRTCPEADRLLLLIKVAEAVAYLHNLSTPIIHGDLRGPNVVVDKYGSPLLIDFGVAMVKEQDDLTFRPYEHASTGNPRWTPPEKQYNSKYSVTVEADCYSMGSLILEVLSGGRPFAEHTTDGAVVLDVVVRKKLPIRPTLSSISDELWSIMERCWSHDPSQRPSMDNIHAALTSIHSTTGANRSPIFEKLARPIADNSYLPSH